MTEDSLGSLQLSIHYVDHAYNTPTWRWDSRINQWPGHLLWLVAGGRGTIAMQGQATYAIGAGDCFLFDMRRVHHGRNDPEQPLEIYTIGFVAADPSGQEKRLVWPGQKRHRWVPSWVALASDMERVLFARRRGAHGDAERGLRRLLATIHEIDHRTQPTGPERDVYDRLTTVAAEIIAAPTARWTVTSLARRIGVGREHFTRVFAKLHGMSPGMFAIQVRMDRAKALLRGTTASIGDVASMLGYDSQSYFTRQFTRMVGCSPRMYRQSLGGWDTGNVVGESGDL